MHGDPTKLVSLDQVGCWHVVDCAGNDERRALDLFDRIHVVLDHRVHERLGEAVRDGDHNMETGALDRERARARERILTDTTTLHRTSA